MLILCVISFGLICVLGCKADDNSETDSEQNSQVDVSGNVISIPECGGLCSSIKECNTDLLWSESYNCVCGKVKTQSEETDIPEGCVAFKHRSMSCDSNCYVLKTECGGHKIIKEIENNQ